MAFRPLSLTAGVYYRCKRCVLTKPTLRVPLHAFRTAKCVLKNCGDWSRQSPSYGCCVSSLDAPADVTETCSTFVWLLTWPRHAALCIRCTSGRDRDMQHVAGRSSVVMYRWWHVLHIIIMKVFQTEQRAFREGGREVEWVVCGLCVCVWVCVCVECVFLSFIGGCRSGQYCWCSWALKESLDVSGGCLWKCLLWWF